MKLLGYTIFDNKALQYRVPFFTHTDGAAVRMLQDLVEDPQTTIGRHPMDYVLYCCGEYDDSNGQLWPLQPLRHVMDAAALVKIQSDFFESNSAAHTVREFADAVKKGMK